MRKLIDLVRALVRGLSWRRARAVADGRQALRAAADLVRRGDVDGGVAMLGRLGDEHLAAACRAFARQRRHGRVR